MIFKKLLITLLLTNAAFLVTTITLKPNCVLQIGNTCFQCAGDSYLTLSNDCVSLEPVANCATYDDSDPFACAICIFGFRLRTDTCQAIDFCVTYVLDQPEIQCAVCTAGRHPTGDGRICLPQIDHCVTYDSSTAFNSANLKCETCSANSL